MEALICSITAAGPVANRPPHMRCAPPTGCATFDSSAGILSAAGGDGGCLMVKRVVPALVGAVLVLAAVWVGLQYRGAGTPPSTDGAAVSAPPLSGTLANFTPANPERPAPIEPFLDVDGKEITL